MGGRDQENLGSALVLKDRTKYPDDGSNNTEIRRIKF